MKGLVRGPRPFTGISRFTNEPVGGTGLETPGTPGRTPKTAQEAREFVRAWVALGADMIQFAEGGLPIEIYRAAAEEARTLGKPTFMRAYGPVLGPREAAGLGTTNLPHSAGIGRTVARVPPTSEDDPRNEADLYSEMDEAKAKDLIQLLVKNNVPHDNRANGSGALYVFTRSGGTWTEDAYIKGSKTEATDQMGYIVAISDDGSTIATGAGDEDCLTPGINPAGCDADSPPLGGANIWVGAAYVFVRSGGVWSEQAFIKANNPRPYNSFGVKLALSRDGNTLAVASDVEDNAGRGIRPPEPQPFLIVDYLDPWREHQNRAEESGAVYVYTRTGGTWTQRAYVKGSNTDAGDEFGSAVALSADGRMMIVGAHNEDSAAPGGKGNPADNSADDSGAAYVFTY